MNFHKLLTANKYKSFEQLEKEICKIQDLKEKGDIFEQFVKAYFVLNKQLYQLKEVYLFNEIPYPIKKLLQLEKKDYGVDGILVLTDNKIAAFQVKFRSDRSTPPFSELSTFLSESFKSDYKYIISNSYEIPSSVRKHPNIIEVLVNTLEALDGSFFEELYNLCSFKKPITKKLMPLPHQERAINNIIQGFKSNDRGKYISACGTGKTLTALWVIEKLNYQNVLFVVPSLALIKQTLESWSKQTKTGFNYLCVCSDNTVSQDLEVDDEDIPIEEIGVPVTTNPKDISHFISHNGKIIKIIFSTYQSLDVLADGLKSKKDFSFDILICDEAHRTVGIKDSLFGIALDDDKIRSKKRLFMTATEKMVTPRIKKKLEELNVVVFSMDDIKKYGVVFERLTFGDAITMNIISDYRIVIAAITEKEGYSLIEDNRFIKIKNNGVERHTTAKNLFKQILLTKCIKEYSIKKAIAFHSSIKNSKRFVSDDTSTITLNELIKSTLKNSEGIFVEHIDGSMSTGERTKIFDFFKVANISIVSNARCLTEGVDVPIVDAVYFVNPKNSLVDIVQAIGRALRKPDKIKKMAYVVIPVIIPKFKSEDEVFEEEEFEYLFYVVQALRDQDTRLADYIDNINLYMAEGGHIKDFSSGDISPIVLSLSKEINFEKFSNSIHLKIAERNASATVYEFLKKKYDKFELKSGYQRKFKTVGDYQPPGYKDMVDKTIYKFKDENHVLRKEKLIIDHNNFSHTNRLGLLVEEGKNCKLSFLGKQFYNKKINFEDVFKKAMLSKDDINFYPYITSLKILLNVKEINFLQFLYGLYIIKNSSNNEIKEAINRIQELKKYKYNLVIANEKNRRLLLKSLNKKYNLNFSDPDLLMKTTAGNQFKYLSGHLSLFKDIIVYDQKNKIIIVKDLKKLEGLIKSF